MSRQLNLRVSDEFAERLERVAKSSGRPMSAVLEAVGTPALDAVEADALFESEALAAWEAYQMNGVHVTTEAVDVLFGKALKQARSIARSGGKA
jgi:predicted transcriptional regulator